jgi:hypothetical protein
MKDFLKSIETYLSFAEGEGEPANRAALHARAKELLEQLESGRAEFNELRTYWFFWNGSGDMTISTGSSPEDAFTKAGYGGGAMRALDYYTVVYYGRALLDCNLAWPDKAGDQRKVLEHVIAEIPKAFAGLSKEEMLEPLDDLSYMVIKAEERFGAEHFVHAELHTAYVAAWDNYKKL